MKNIILISAVLGYALMFTGCSRTWSGVKQDTSELLLGTQEVIHEATAPITIQETSSSAQRKVVENSAAQTLHPAIPTAN